MILRLAFAADPARVREELEAQGARVDSAAAGLITAVMTPAQLKTIEDSAWLIAVQEPRRLAARLPPSRGER